MKGKSDDAIKCVCIREGFFNVLTSEYDLCGDYIRNYIVRTVVTIVVSFIVSMINFMLKVTFRMLAKFERYKRYAA